eukprot:SAG25_NODE_8281_length_430_cov_0.767372_1_plen_72_part_10
MPSTAGGTIRKWLAQLHGLPLGWHAEAQVLGFGGVHVAAPCAERAVEALARAGGEREHCKAQAQPKPPQAAG